MKSLYCSFKLLLILFDLVRIGNSFIIKQTDFFYLALIIAILHTLIRIYKSIVNMYSVLGSFSRELNIAITHSYRVDWALLYTSASIQWGIVHLMRLRQTDECGFSICIIIQMHLTLSSRRLLHCPSKQKTPMAKIVARNADKKTSSLWCNHSPLTTCATNVYNKLASKLVPKLNSCIIFEKIFIWKSQGSLIISRVLRQVVVNRTLSFDVIGIP